MESLDSWFRREVYQWRVGASVVWTTLSVPPVFMVYLLLACFMPLHPVLWVSDVFLKLMTLSFWGTMVTVMLILGGLSVYNSTHFTVVADVPLTRASALVRLLKFPCLLHGAVFSLAGGVIAWCCSGLIGHQYDQLTEKCSEGSEKNCFNERHMFLVCHGVFVGWMFHLLFWLQQDNYIQFPLLQAKFFRVKSSLWPLMERSLSFDLTFVKYFYLLYFLLGHIPRNWLLRNLYLESRAEPPLNTVFGMMDLELLWEVTLSGTLIYALLSYSTFLYKVYNAEPFTFPIESMYEDYKNKCLHHALECSKFPLVKYLGFMDLHRLTRHTPTRRRQLFTLSQPGGHPHNWNNVYRVCIDEIDSLTKSLEEHNWKAFAAPPLRHSSGDNPAQGLGTTGVSTVSFRGSSAPVTAIGSVQPQQAKPQADPVKKLLESLKKKPVLKYLLADLPEAAATRLFSTAQTHIWAVEALSAIVANSYTEDPYGVVQKSLPDILRSMLDLQEKVEKHFKLAPVTSRRSQNQSSTNDSGLRHSLRSSLKMSLYRIVNTFGSHLSEIKLSPEHSKRLKFFMDYKE